MFKTITKRKLFWLKVFLTITSLLIAIVVKFKLGFVGVMERNQAGKQALEFFYDLSVGVFSAMILVWFVEETNNHLAERLSKQKEAKTILVFNSLFKNYLNHYFIALYCLTTPVKYRNFDMSRWDWHGKPERLSDLQDLYEKTLLLTRDLSESSMEYFSQAEENLYREANSFIITHKLKHFSEIENILTELVSLHSKKSANPIWISCSNIPNAKKVLKDILKNQADNWYETGHDINGNLIAPYFLLFELLKEEEIIIDKYLNAIKKIEDEYNYERERNRMDRRYSR